MTKAFITAAIGSVIVAVVLAAIAMLVIALWRRPGEGPSTTSTATSTTRIDSHAVNAPGSSRASMPKPPASTSAPGVSAEPTRAAATQLVSAPSAAPPAPVVPSSGDDGMTDGGRPHPSGLGAAELAAIVEEGLAGLADDLEVVETLIESMVAASTVPESLTARPAAHQIAHIDQVVAEVAPQLDRAVGLAEALRDDVQRGIDAQAVVHAELVRLGLPTGFFATMEASAAAVGAGLVRATIAAQRLARRFDGLSSLYSSARSLTGGFLQLQSSIAEAAARADPWRVATAPVDLSEHSPAAPLSR